MVAWGAILTIAGQGVQTGAGVASTLENVGRLKDRAKQQRILTALEEGRFRRNARRFRGTQQAMLAATGQDLSSETALNLEADTVTQQELDALAIRYTGETKAANLEIAAKDQKKSAFMSLLTGGSGLGSSIGSLVGGGK